MPFNRPPAPTPRPQVTGTHHGQAKYTKTFLARSIVPDSNIQISTCCTASPPESFASLLLHLGRLCGQCMQIDVPPARLFTHYRQTTFRGRKRLAWHRAEEDARPRAAQSKPTCASPSPPAAPCCAAAGASPHRPSRSLAGPSSLLALSLFLRFPLAPCVSGPFDLDPLSYCVPSPVLDLHRPPRIGSRS